MNYAERACRVMDRELLARGLHAPPSLVRLYTLLVLTTGTETTRENVHDAWALWRAPTQPDHPVLLPFLKLDPAAREQVRPYMEAICAVAEEN